MKGLNDLLKSAHVKRAAKRKHKPCPSHGAIRRVCESCTKVYCPKCGTHPCNVPRETKKTVPVIDYIPPKGLEPIWRFAQQFGAIDIQPHPDADAWRIRFPPHTLGTQGAGELADRLWSHSELASVAVTTPFRAGRGHEPPHWWISFQLKEAA